MKRYVLPFSWWVSFPKDWLHDVEPYPEANQYLFYPADSDLTFRVSVLHAERQGKPAPAALLMEGFLQGCQVDGPVPELQGFAVPGCLFESRRGKSGPDDAGRVVYHAVCAAAADGELLTMNVFATDEQALNDALQYMRTIGR